MQALDVTCSRERAIQIAPVKCRTHLDGKSRSAGNASAGCRPLVKFTDGLVQFVINKLLDGFFRIARQFGFISQLGQSRNQGNASVPEIHLKIAPSTDSTHLPHQVVLRLGISKRHLINIGHERVATSYNGVVIIFHCARTCSRTVTHILVTARTCEAVANVGHAIGKEHLRGAGSRADPIFIASHRSLLSVAFSFPECGRRQGIFGSSVKEIVTRGHQNTCQQNGQEKVIWFHKRLLLKG